MTNITWLKHLEIALYFGLMTGFVFGFIDSFSRVFVWSFEWFEVYQAFMISMSITISLYFLIYVMASCVFKVIRCDLNDVFLNYFYFVSSIFFIMFIYIELVLNLYVFSGVIWTSNNFFYSLLVFFVLFFGYLIVLIFFQDRFYCIFQYFKSEKSKFIQDILFAVVLFILFSLIIDLYQINNYTIATKSQQEGPNVILISLDTLRADYLSLYNESMGTSPNLKKIGKNSAVFENALSVTSWTLPAHASIFTGKYPFNHNTTKIDQLLRAEENTLAEILSSNGYNTAAFVSGSYVNSKYGLSQGFETYKDRLDFISIAHTFDKFSLKKALNPMINLFSGKVYTDTGELSYFYRNILGSDLMKTAEENNEMIFSWLEKNKNNKFFLFLHYFDPHDPYTLGEQFREKFTNITKKSYLRLDVDKRYMPVNKTDLEYVKSLYKAEIFYLDAYLGKLFEQLENMELINKSILIITSDHGEEFYDHGNFFHQRTLYEEVLKVPLIIHYPGKIKPSVIAQRVQNMDVFPTILDLLNINKPEDIDALSLMQLIKGVDYSRNWTHSALYGIKERGEFTQKSITINNTKLITTGGHPEISDSLFDLENDLKEQNNLYEIEKKNTERLKSKLIKISSK